MLSMKELEKSLNLICTSGQEPCSFSEQAEKESKGHKWLASAESGHKNGVCGDAVCHRQCLNVVHNHNKFVSGMVVLI